MTVDTEAVRNYFAKLQLEPEIADIYVALHTHGPQSLSELARTSGIERTRIYRLMEPLTASSLIEVEQQYKRSILRAAPITNLQVLISKKEQEMHDLQTGLNDLNHAFIQSSLSSPASRVQFYQGAEGLKQMFWNQTKAQTENLSILYENMQSRTNLTFFERWAQTCNERGITFRSIVGDRFNGTQDEWYDTHTNERLKHWQSRYASDELFEITHSTMIYDDITAYYNWKDGEIFGIEIKNAEIANAQRQFFEMLWAQAKTS